MPRTVAIEVTKILFKVGRGDLLSKDLATLAQWVGTVVPQDLKDFESDLHDEYDHEKSKRCTWEDYLEGEMDPVNEWLRHFFEQQPDGSWKRLEG